MLMSKMGRGMLKSLIEIVGLSFHPDKFFSDYEDSEGNKRFSEKDCEFYEKALSVITTDFKMDNECIYEATIRRFNIMHKQGRL